MRVISPSSYAQWRLLAFSGEALRETTEYPWMSERLLQLIWHYQRLLRDKLETLDHQHVLVLHPGFWNREAGPDFRGAIIRFGSGLTQTGDVEIDLEPYGWRGHHHDQNPAYKNVILHVVWDCDPKIATPIPTLRLKPFLDAPLKDLRHWLGRNPLKRFSEPLHGECCAPLKELPPAVLAELLRQAALIRLQAKAAEFEARARQVGWELALWEGIFGALGYKHNVWPMRRIGELLPGILGRQHSASVLWLQAVLLGMSGLLPAEISVARPTVQCYFRSLWDVWWRFRESFVDSILPRGFWRLNGLRPANHPQRRLALASHWLASGDLLPKLEVWFSAETPDRMLLRSLLEVFQVSRDDFWSWHWTLTSPRLRKPPPLIGLQRVTDLAMNVILPWFWMRAAAGKNETLQAVAEHRYFVWPRSQDNAILRLARQRLFGGEEKRFLKTAAAQQGLLQIVRDFCDHSNALCENCRFPELVRDLE